MARITLNLNSIILSNPILAASVWLEKKDVEQEVDNWIINAAASRIVDESKENEEIWITIRDDEKERLFHFRREANFTKGGTISSIARGTAEYEKVFMKISNNKGLTLDFPIHYWVGERQGGAINAVKSTIGGAKEAVTEFSSAISGFGEKLKKDLESLNPMKKVDEELEKFNQ